MNLLKKEESDMNNVKKRLIVFSSLILTLCLGLFFVFGVDHPDFTDTNISVTMPFNAYGNNISKGGTNETFNFTFTLPSTMNDTQDNISEVSFEVPTNVVMDDYGNVSNGTNLVGWVCNSSDPDNDTYFNWTCANDTGPSLYGAGDEFSIWFNASINDTGMDDDAAVWSIRITNGVDGVTSNTTEVSTQIDSIAPRLYDLNISDGNSTLFNGTTVAGVWLNGSSLANATSYLLYGANITVEATINDSHLRSVFLFCDNFSSPADMEDGNATGTSYALDSVNNSGEQITRGLSDQSTLYRYTGAIPSACLVDGNITDFVIGINDSMDHYVQFNETSVAVDKAFSFTTNSTLNRVDMVNVSTGDYSLTTLDGQLTGSNYLKASPMTIYFNVLESGEFKSDTNQTVMVHYNETGNMTVMPNGIILDSTLALSWEPEPVDRDMVYNQTMINTTAGDYNTTYYTFFNFSGTGNDTQTVEFYIVVNDSVGYTTTSGPHRFIIDAVTPTLPEMTVPTDRSVGFSDTITYSCDSSDAGVGLGTWEWTLTRPDGTTVTNTGGTSVTDSISYSSLSQAGTYTVKCKSQDLLAQVNSYTAGETETFVVLYSTSAGSGGGSGGGTSTTVSFDIDFSGTVSEATLKGNEGVIKTFSFDGATKHKITFKEVAADKIVLEIASTPVTIELALGETKDVDVNGDGISDISVTYNSLENDKADITVKKFEEGAEIVKAEEEAARGVEEEAPTTGAPTTTEEAKSNAWIWILVLVVVVVGAVAYFVMRKK